MSEHNRSSHGGEKYNVGNLKLYPAGKSTEKGKDHVSDHFKHYLLKDDRALVQDALIRTPIIQQYTNVQSTGSDNIQTNTFETDTKDSRIAHVGVPRTLKHDISCVLGFALGQYNPSTKLPECVKVLEIETGREFFLECISYLNSLRKSLSTRVDASFFRLFYLHLQYLDEAGTGWLPKQVVYDYCATKYVRFDPSLIEPVLKLWNAFDGSQIEYKIFVHVINYREPSSGLPIIPDVSAECIKFSTTYNDIVETQQRGDTKVVAGMPSRRYLDNCNAVIPIGYYKENCFSKESDIISCLIPKKPNYLTLLDVSPQDMYSTRSPELIRTVSEAAGVIFTDEKFKEIWDTAKTYHSRGLVSYETFKRAFLKYTYNV